MVYLSLRSHVVINVTVDCSLKAVRQVDWWWTAVAYNVCVLK